MDFRAFDLGEESFRISYYCANEWLPMLSDWDLDAAVLSASDPCLQLALLEASNREKINLIAEEEAKSRLSIKFRIFCQFFHLQYLNIRR